MKIWKEELEYNCGVAKIAKRMNHHMADLLQNKYITNTIESKPNNA